MGETGTGKELVARLIHALDNRPGKRDLVLLDCTTIVPELSGSEFFGHERGAYTGAVSARDGAFALANGGTLFLDEAGELPPTLQSQLLRVIEEGAYKRVGSNTWHKTAFRLICATNRDLLQEVAQHRFRRDLYYRLASWVCILPPLRERTADILPLARHFMLEHLQAHQQPQTEPPELATLCAIIWCCVNIPATCAICGKSSGASWIVTLASAPSRSASCPKKTSWRATVA